MSNQTFPPDRFHPPAGLWLVPVLSVILTGFAWHVTRMATDARASERFAFRTSVIQSVIQQRLSRHVNMLSGVVGLFDASDDVSRAEWQAYLAAAHPETGAPGLQAIGFSIHLPAAERRALEHRAHEEGWPLAVWPLNDEDDFHSIVYIYPFNGKNLRAFGYDMFSEPVRREAMMRARDQNGPALSGQVRLVQENEQDPAQPGFLLYLPVYDMSRPLDSVVNRRAALRGFVYGAFRSRDLMKSVFGGQQWDVDFEIYDGDRPTSPRLLYRDSVDDAPVADTLASGALFESTPLEFAGHRWLLIVRPSKNFLSFADRYQSWVIAASAIAINVLVGLGLWVSAAVRTRALRLAEGMAEAIRDNEAQTQLMVESITNHAIFRLDAQGNVSSWNASARRTLGYNHDEVISQPASRFWAGTDVNPYSGSLSLDDRQTHEGWHVRKDGYRFWGVVTIAPLRHAVDAAAGHVVILRDDSSRRQAIEALAATSAELEQRTIELGRFNRLASGRELRMVELKRMVNERSIRLGMAPPFDLSFADDFKDVQRPGESL